MNGGAVPCKSVPTLLQHTGAYKVSFAPVMHISCTLKRHFNLRFALLHYSTPYAERVDITLLPILI